AHAEESADARKRRRDRDATPRPRGPRLPDKLPALAVAPDEGDYADSLESLSPAAAAFERSPQAGYSYCLRVSAVYENVYYGRDGQLRRTYHRASHHGTAFAYKERDGEYFLATNSHVAALPEVTTAERPVQGVPAGSRKLRETLRLVQSEEDNDVGAQVEVARVLVDVRNDLAILKTRKPLHVMPYRFGRSAGLRVGNVVVARGFPLGVFATSNVGRVTNAHHDDTDLSWDHTDFVTDAALNSGNSGSPVFALSRKTREYELVGIFHAQYRNAHGMGVVVGIDQLRRTLETLQLDEPPEPVALDSAASREMLARFGGHLFFPFAGLTARAERRDDGVVFTVFEDFPVSDAALLSLVSGDASTVIELPERHGARGAPTLDEQAQHLVERLDTELWESLGLALQLRTLQRERARLNPEGRRELQQVRKRLQARAGEQKELLATIDVASEDALFLHARSGPGPSPEATVRHP
ncbi:MAG: trypsin-like peptidase domain-containing protein, partial [Myxococcales bacterium]